MARALCAAGAHVIVNGRDPTALMQFAAGLADEGYDVEAAAFDAHDVTKIREFFGQRKRLDVLVNNIGFMQNKAFHDLAQEDFAALMGRPSSRPLRPCGPLCRPSRPRCPRVAMPV